MAKAYNHTRHFRSQKDTNPEACFEETLQAAKDAHVDAIVLNGDIFSFPSEAAIEWVMTRLDKAGLPWLYTAGNHDWHYEGMAGTSAELRSAWISKRLSPLYQGRQPQMSVLELAGVKVVVMDNSTYEITPEQLEFFRHQVASGQPLILCLHIPLYAPGRPVGFGCGHPGWGAKADKNFAIERRPKWRESHTSATMDFHKEVFSSPNLLGVFAGHTHQASLDVLNGIPQVVAGANATGSHLITEVLPPA
jgi:predicted phosphodiesterase